jgi:hypothetical protein
VYKLAGSDGKGAWFARRSVHEGLAFTTWRSKLKHEFQQTIRIRRGNASVGTSGGGAIRGVGAERRLEEIAVPEILGDGLYRGEMGLVEVYHLSARFPGPASPRDFVALLITSDMALEMKEYSAAGKENCDTNSPRNYMVISKPCEHPDAPARQGYIRGKYESVEFIREIPSARQRNPSRSIDTQWDDDNVGQNPVEWIMVTRSDPGGNVPRWMVERGTPPSIVADVKKFLDWACYKDELPGGAKGGSNNVSESLKVEILLRY